MAEYIKRDAALKALCQVSAPTPDESYIVEKCIEKINRLPMMEVVRCKDCKHSVWDEENEMWKCIESAEYDSNFGDYIGWIAYHNADYYCADGERKDNAN